MTPANQSVEAPQGDRSSSNAELTDTGVVEQQLERADGGAAAWKVLCATFVFEAVLFGEHHLDCCLEKTHSSDRLQAFPYRSVCSKTITRSSQNSRATHTYRSSGQWRLAYRISVGP